MNQTSIDETAVHGANATSNGDRPRGTDSRRIRLKFSAARWVSAGRNLGIQIEEQVQKRPFVLLGAMAGVGFAAGSLFGSRLGQLVLAAGIGYCVRNAAGPDAGMGRVRAGLERLAGEADVD
jgi:hypothetical protein